MKTSLFFSGELMPDSPLADFCRQNNWSLTARSLLRFEAVPISIQQPFDVVFISSIRSYNYFISQINDSYSYELACIGSQTANRINEQSSLISFTGQRAGHPEEVAEEFKQWLGNRRVLFPVAEGSNRTVADAIPANQKEVVVCYRTLPVEQTIAEHSIYVFTSPSNVHAFLLVNKLPPAASVIAWGSKTKQKLQLHGIQPWQTLNESTENELVEMLGNIGDSHLS